MTDRSRFGTRADDFAKELGVNRAWLVRQAQERDWPRVKVGGQVWFPDEAVAAIRAAHTKGDLPAPNPNGRVTRR